MINKLTPVFCLLAHTAVVSHLMILFYKLAGSPEIQKMKSKFSDQQKRIHKEINTERRLHYLYGLLLGMAISIFYLGMYPNISHPICAYIGLSTMIAQNFYLLMPKSKWMIDYIEHPEDIYHWNQVYQKFRYLSAYGNFLGFVFFAAGRI